MFCSCNNPACQARISRGLTPFCQMLPPAAGSVEPNVYGSYAEAAQHSRPGPTDPFCHGERRPEALCGAAIMKPFLLGTFVTFSLLSGCALAPNTVRLEAEHTSHLLQHLGARSTCATPGNCGWDTLAVEAHWQTRGWFLDASEGYVIEQCDGLHEEFQARVGYEFQVKAP